MKILVPFLSGVLFGRENPVKWGIGVKMSEIFLWIFFFKFIRNFLKFRKISKFIFQKNFAIFTPPQQSKSVNSDIWPTNYTNVARIFQTYPEWPNEEKLLGYGRVPPWVDGTFYRNGPAIYEWGDDQYKHFFDPTGMIQAKVCKIYII